MSELANLENGYFHLFSKSNKAKIGTIENALVTSWNVPKWRNVCILKTVPAFQMIVQTVTSAKFQSEVETLQSSDIFFYGSCEWLKWSRYIFKDVRKGIFLKHYRARDNHWFHRLKFRWVAKTFLGCPQCFRSTIKKKCRSIDGRSNGKLWKLTAFLEGFFITISSSTSSSSLIRHHQFHVWINLSNICQYF